MTTVERACMAGHLLTLEARRDRLREELSMTELEIATEQERLAGGASS